MKPALLFIYSIIAYLIGFASLVFFIVFLSNIIPEISIDRDPEAPFLFALIKNIGLVLLFVVPHSVMARRWFKERIVRVIPQPIERSTYVLQSGLFLYILVWQWEPLGGTIWNIAVGNPLYHVMYFLFFTGLIILFVSTFLINHFDLFGLRQTYLELMGKPYKPVDFKLVAFYKYVRHPLYLGIIISLFATPIMTVTHLALAVLLTLYILIGVSFEEKDLSKELGEPYQLYKKQTPMLFPFHKRVRK